MRGVVIFGKFIFHTKVTFISKKDHFLERDKSNEKTATLISLGILTSSVILTSYVSATTPNSSMPSSLVTEESNSIKTPRTSITEESGSENAQIPDITTSRKPTSQYAGISLWVSAKITILKII